jgi:hypothetical protein
MESLVSSDIAYTLEYRPDTTATVPHGQYSAVYYYVHQLKQIERAAQGNGHALPRSAWTAGVSRSVIEYFSRDSSMWRVDYTHAFRLLLRRRVNAYAPFASWHILLFLSYRASSTDIYMIIRPLIGDGCLIMCPMDGWMDGWRRFRHQAEKNQQRHRPTIIRAGAGRASDSQAANPHYYYYYFHITNTYSTPAKYNC